MSYHKFFLAAYQKGLIGTSIPMAPIINGLNPSNPNNDISHSKEIITESVGVGNIIENAIQNTTDNVSEMTNIIGEQFIEALSGALEGYIDAAYTKIIVTVMDLFNGAINTFMEPIKNLFFGYEGLVGPFAAIHAILGGSAAIFLMIIIIKKAIQNQMNLAGSGDYVPPTQLIMDVIKSSGLAVVLPWLVSFITAILPVIMMQIATDSIYGYYAPTWKWMNLLPDDAKTHVAGGFMEWMKPKLNPAWWVLYLFLECMVLIGIICFLIKMCKYHVEIMLIDLFALPAAISSVTDNKSLYSIWLQSIEALVISNIADILFFALMIQQFTILIQGAASFSSYHSILAIGASCCLIKGTIFTNKFKQGGAVGAGTNAVANVARTAFMVMPK